MFSYESVLVIGSIFYGIAWRREQNKIMVYIMGVGEVVMICDLLVITAVIIKYSKRLYQIMKIKDEASSGSQENL